MERRFAREDLGPHDFGPGGTAHGGSKADELRTAVWRANLELVKKGLVIETWGNVSGVDRESGILFIKPSGIPYEEMRPEDMVEVDLESGRPTGGCLRPSSDLETHLELYRSFPEIGGVVHTHSRWATIFAQAGRGIPPFGTTHGDDFYGEIPCTRPMMPEEIEGDYERETGRVIVETFLGQDPACVPAVLVRGHGPFAWGGFPRRGGLPCRGT